MLRSAAHWRPLLIPLIAKATVTFALVLSVLGWSRLDAAGQVDVGFSPTSGHAQVIAQGVVELPQGDTVWRTVRTRAPLPADAPFDERPLGFVLATSGPLLLVDQVTGEQTQLGTGEAALVRAGTVQQRASLGQQPVSYLSVELVSVDAPPPPEDAIVLQPGQPFPAPAGLHDVDLLSDTLRGDETLTIPDSGSKNVILITDGTAQVGRPGGEPVALLAGEAASFSGELQVAAAPSEGQSGENRAAFVVAIIGPELPPAVGAPAGASPAATEQAAATGTSESAAGQGTIRLQVFTCPSGMNAQTVEAAACTPTDEDFDVTLSGATLAAPLTIGDASGEGGTFVWGGLPYGTYTIAEAVLPAGSTTYALAAKDSSGNPDIGYQITIGPDREKVTVRIYNFTQS